MSIRAAALQAVLLLACVTIGVDAYAFASPLPPTSPRAQQSSDSSGQASGQTEQGADAQDISSVVPLRLENSYQGLKITSVQFQGLPRDSRAVDHLRELGLAEGEVLDRGKLNQSVRTLYATGRFADIQVEAQRTAQGTVSLTYVATPNYFIGRVSVQGAPKRPSGAQLADSSRLRLGEPYSREKVEKGLALMKELLADNGYYQAEITYQEHFDSDAQQVEIEVAVVPNQPAKIGEVLVQGDPGYSPEEIRKIAGLGEGHTVTGDRLAKALQRLRKRYSDEDRLEADMVLTGHEYHPDTNTLDFTFRIDRGHVVTVDVSGAGISKRKLKQLAPVFSEHAVDNDLLNEGMRNLRDYFQKQGYFDVSVSVKREQTGDNLHIVYVVERGERHNLIGVEIKGNDYFDSALIQERMQVRPRGWLLSHGLFSQELLDDDVQSILNLYRSNGFLQAKVTAEAKDNYENQPGQMMVFVNVDEGSQTRVSSLQIEGNEHVSDDQLRNLLTTSEGQPYSESNIASDRDQIMNYYFNQGFADVSFQADSAADPAQPGKMRVTYHIQEGSQVFIDRILMSGLNFTKPSIARRQLHIQSGAPLSQSGLLETQRSLYDLGVFNEVKMAVQNQDGAAEYKNVLLQFSEAQRWTFNYGLGVEIQSGAFGAVETDPLGHTGVSPTVSFDVSRINFGGRAHTLSFQSHLGRLQQRGLLSYDAPRFTNNNNLRLTLNLFYDNSLDVRTFTSQRIESSVQLEQIASRRANGVPVNTLLYRFTYRRVRATDLKIDPNSPDVPLLSRPVRVGMPSVTYIRDKRDDPIDPRNGNYTTVDTGIASKIFGSEATFGRVLAQNSTYHPFHSEEWVFARNTRIGLSEPFGSTSLIPLPERFFAGGATTLRGFPINQAGPRDTTTGLPLGGEAVIINNLELRTPPLPLPFVQNNLSFVVFHDAGNVFRSTSEMFNNLFRWSQKDAFLCTAEATSSQCDFAFVSHALGAGIRYKTPIGPVRVDVGYNLNPAVFPFFQQQPDGTEVFTSQRIGRWHYSFSIGQTF